MTRGRRRGPARPPGAAGETGHGGGGQALVLKKYGNRRLYDTARSRFVTLEDVAKMVADGTDIVVRDASTGQDLTRLTLLQIILELHKSKVEVLPVQFLRQVITYREETLRQFFERYLAFSLQMYASASDQFARRLAEGFERSLAGITQPAASSWMSMMPAPWMPGASPAGASTGAAGTVPSGPGAPGPMGEGAASAGTSGAGAATASGSTSAGAGKGGAVEALELRIAQLEERLARTSSRRRPRQRGASPRRR